MPLTLTREQLIDALKVREEIDRRTRERRLLTYYPDSGPLCRELYQKHQQFFAAGIDHRERLMLAANRVGKCITIDSCVETTEGRKTVLQLIEENKPFEVWAWTGSEKVRSMASVPFRKNGIHECYRITMADGQWIECADHHRFLTYDGWQRLSEFLAGCGQDLLCSSLAPDQKVRVLGGLDSSEKVQDYTQYYSLDYRQYGELPPNEGDVGQDVSPQPNDALPCNGPLWRLDGQGNRSSRIRRPRGAHPSMTGEVRHFAGLFFEFLIRIFYTNAEWLCDSFPILMQPALVSAFEPQLNLSQFQSSRETHHANSSAFVLTSNKIISIIPIGRKPVYDFTVDTWHNYIAADLVHHNTEGVGGYELTLHLTGWYPAWWVGRRFTRQVKAWACGDTSKTVREIIQNKLFGPPEAWGTGLIPGECIERVIRATGTPDLIDSAWIKHRTGKTSHLVLKYYEQGRKAFEGTEQDVIWDDEEPPMDVYTEQLLRTMMSNGMVMLTFTPLQGVSDVVLAFLPDGKLQEQESKKFVVMATWDDAPHLSDEAKAELWESIPAYQRDARSKGIPQLGSGAIYPVPESSIEVEPFTIPDYWPRAYAMDVGWNCTAGLWGAWDRENDTIYFYHAYKRGQCEPDVHASAFKRQGEWVRGVIDPASRGRSQNDGTQLMETYKSLGLLLEVANNAVEAGIYDVWQRMVTGRLKVFKTLGEWFSEFRMYRRNEKGQVVKDNDHLMDDTRYFVATALKHAKIKPLAPVERIEYRSREGNEQAWMG